MHGIIFSELKKYVDTKLGGNAWSNLQKESRVGAKTYLAIQEYPDQEAVSLVSTASRITGKSVPAILEDFGEFIAPDLIGMYKGLIKPGWKTIDLIKNTEETIHKIVRLKNPGAKPAELKCSSPSPDEVVITYSSPRKMCSVAKGIAKGVAKHYNERILISEPACMLKGSPSCKISIKLMK